MRDLAFILDENGIRVRILKIDKPGIVLYEDEYQAVSQNRTHRKTIKTKHSNL
jgi:hypothetical protein